MVDLRDIPGESNSAKRLEGSFIFINTPGAAGDPGLYTFLENSARTSAFIAPFGTNNFTQVWPR
ncbi:MAG: hypothetical protein LR015_15750 [Verrucomicrobia bacterium]|nr:hypothetical protein [Verrucomicrobiota bacterium]